MHAKVRRESVAGYATDETLVCGPKEHTRWWQRYRGHLQGLLYRLILNSYLFIANIHKRWPSCLSNRQILSTKTHFSCLFRQCRQPGHAGLPPHCHGRSRLALTPTHRAPRNRPRRPAKRPVSACKTAHTGSPYGTFLQRAAWHIHKKTCVTYCTHIGKVLAQELSKRKNRTFCIYLRNKSLSLQCYPQTETTQWARWEGRHIYG